MNGNDQFNAFLKGINQDYQNELVKSFYKKEIEEEARAALEAVHFEPLEEGSERYRRLWDEIEAELREHYASEVSNEDFESYVAQECAARLLAMSVTEEAYIATIEMLYFAAHQADETKRDPVVIRQTKMGIMADMVIVGQILTDSPLMRFANDFAPGGSVDFEDPEMQPYLVESLEKVKHTRAATQRSSEIVKIAYKIAGIESRHNEEVERIQNAIRDMLLVSDYEEGGVRDHANRQEALYNIAREAGLDLYVTQKLVAYFEETFPL